MGQKLGYRKAVEGQILSIQANLRNWPLLLIILGIVAILSGYAATTASLWVYLLLVGFAIVSWLLRTFESLLVAFFWLPLLIGVAKRAIFLTGDQPKFVYYSVLLLPTVLYLPLLWLAWRRVEANGWGGSARWLLIFAGWSLVCTFLPLTDIPLTGRLAAVYEQILPMMVFLFGLAAPLGSETFRRSGKAIVLAGVVSVPYGLMQQVVGPTFLDRAWATGTHLYSIQGQNVWLYLVGAIGRVGWRSFSFYSDPLTWGMVLVAACGTLLVVSCFEDKPKRWILLLPVLVIGLVLCMTRTPWAGLLSMFGFCTLLEWKVMRRPLSLFLLFGFGFYFVLVIGSFLYTKVMPIMPWATLASNPLLLRYLTIGTIVDRLGAGTDLVRSFLKYPVVGPGFANNYFYSHTLGGMGGGHAHNFVVQLVANVGGGGILLFAAFLFVLLKEGTNVLETSEKPQAVRWLLAFLLGYAVTGYLNGTDFMDIYFFFLAGVLAGTYRQAAVNQEYRNNRLTGISEPVHCPGEMPVEIQAEERGDLSGTDAQLFHCRVPQVWDDSDA